MNPDETSVAVKDPEKASEAAKGSTSTESAKTYTAEEYQKAISDERASAGREKKALERELSVVKKEAETLKTQLADKEKSITDTQEKISNLEAELEDMAKDDPARANYVKKLKALEKMEAELKKSKEDIESQANALKPEIEQAREIKRMTLMGQIASEFKDGDMDKLRKLCDTARIPDDEDQVRAMAESLWEEAEGPEDRTGETEPPRSLSGDTKGGSEGYTIEQIRDPEFYAKNKEKILEAYWKGKIKTGR